MEIKDLPPPRAPVRKIAIGGETFGFGNIEAWFKIIRSYYTVHPLHQVIIEYRGKQIPGAAHLFKLGKDVDREAFTMTVAAKDEDFSHVHKLHRLLVEAAGSDYQQFLGRELYQAFRLF